MEGLRTEDAVHCTDYKAHWGNVILIFGFINKIILIWFNFFKTLKKTFKKKQYSSFIAQCSHNTDISKFPNIIKVVYCVLSMQVNLTLLTYFTVQRWKCQLAVKERSENMASTNLSVMQNIKHFKYPDIFAETIFFLLWRYLCNNL